MITTHTKVMQSFHIIYQPIKYEVLVLGIHVRVHTLLWGPECVAKELCHSSMLKLNTSGTPYKSKILVHSKFDHGFSTRDSKLVL